MMQALLWNCIEFVEKGDLAMPTMEEIVADLVRHAPWNASEEEKRDEYLDFLAPAVAPAPAPVSEQPA